MQGERQRLWTFANSLTRFLILLLEAPVKEEAKTQGRQAGLGFSPSPLGVKTQICVSQSLSQSHVTQPPKGNPLALPARLCLSSYKEQGRELQVKVRCLEAQHFPPCLTRKERTKEENSTHQPPHENRVTEAGLRIDTVYLVRAF